MKIISLSFLHNLDPVVSLYGLYSVVEHINFYCYSIQYCCINIWHYLMSANAVLDSIVSIVTVYRLDDRDIRVRVAER
jgi:hypothetical protein